METIGIKFTETENHLFGQLWTSCDSDNSGIVSQSVAKQVLRSAQLEPKVLDQIIELIGSSRVVNRKQFYLMLRLVGAAQSGLPLSADTFNANAIPLPQLSPLIVDSNKHQIVANNCDKNLRIESIHQMSGHLPPPPTKPSVRSNRRSNPLSMGDNYKRQPIDSTNNNLNNDSNNCVNNRMNCEQNELTNSRSSSDNDSNGSPIDPMSDKSHEYREKSWSEFNDKTKDKPINWADFDEEHHLLENDEEDEEEEDIKSNASSDDGTDILGINEEQRLYYTNQFKAMQPNLNGRITGNKAKDFFEKSNLPIQELSQIWQMSDIDKDGALTLNEFCIAIHLVVLRRNHIQLPTDLPQSLMSKLSATDTNRMDSLSSAHCPEVPDCELNYSSLSPKQNIDLNELKAKNAETLSPQNKQWTKFTDSPTNQIVVTTVSPPSTSSSAGIPQSLVNFDFNKASIVRDPKILHPVALRLSPDGQPILYDKNETINTSNQSIETASHSVPNSDSFRSLGIIQGKKSPPPPPPPRPTRSHARSSSLDLNRTIGRSVAASDLSSSQMPLQIKGSNSEYGLTVPQKVLSLNTRNIGAFQAYKKNRTETSLTVNNNNNTFERLKNRFKFPAEVVIPDVGADSSELWLTIRSLQEYSKVLSNMNNDLLQEVIKLNECNHSLERKLSSNCKL